MAGSRTRRKDPPRILCEVEAIFCAAIGAVLLLSFVSYLPDTPATNQAGPVGYWIANVLIQTFGRAAYLFPLLLAGAALGLFLHGAKLVSPVRIVGGVALLLETSVAFGLYRQGVVPRLAGGWIGGFLATLLGQAMGVVGSSVLLAAAALLIFIMLTGRPLSDMVRGAVRGAKRAATGVAAMTSRAVVGLWQKVVAVGQWRWPLKGRSWRVRRPQSPPTVVFTPTPEVEPDLARSIVQVGGGLGVRARQSRLPAEPEQEEFRFAVDASQHRLPPLRLLGKHDSKADYGDEKALVNQSKILGQKLATFGVSGRVVAVRPGPVITTFEFEPDPGIKVSRVVNLSDDLTMALRAHSVRIVAPIPGKNVVGIEVSNRNRAIVGLRDLIDSDEFRLLSSSISLALGRDTTGVPVYSDLAKMPHLLMAGATGSGKSVSLNTMIMSILYKATPHDVRFIMIDPKMLELSLYEGISHLLVPVVTDVKKAAAALANIMREMDRRFELMRDKKVRNIDDYNRRVAEEEEADDFVDEDEVEIDEAEAESCGDDEDEEGDIEAADEEQVLKHEHLPRVVVVVDELADLMMTVGREIEESITRLAQKARAAGIHMILATQRPSVDVITGLIKANFPCRISFQVTARPDSRTILDAIGAERLLGSGDMLYLGSGTSFVRRLHGALVTDEEIRAVVEFLKKQGDPDYRMELLETPCADEDAGEEEEFYDELYKRAVDLVVEHGQGSTSWLQRKLGIGYNRAARIIEHMECQGVVGPADGARPRRVLGRHTAR